MSAKKIVIRRIVVLVASRLKSNCSVDKEHNFRAAQDGIPKLVAFGDEGGSGWQPQLEPQIDSATEAGSAEEASEQDTFPKTDQA